MLLVRPKPFFEDRQPSLAFSWVLEGGLFPPHAARCFSTAIESSTFVIFLACGVTKLIRLVRQFHARVLTGVFFRVFSTGTGKRAPAIRRQFRHWIMGHPEPAGIAALVCCTDEGRNRLGRIGIVRNVERHRIRRVEQHCRRSRLGNFQLPLGVHPWGGQFMRLTLSSPGRVFLHIGLG